jgi:hypothetical protein
MVCFQTKHPNLGKFWRALDWKMLIYFMATWNILWRFGIFCDRLVHFVFIWYIFQVLVSCTNKNLATLAVTYDGATYRWETECPNLLTEVPTFVKCSKLQCFYQSRKKIYSFESTLGYLIRCNSQS